MHVAHFVQRYPPALGGSEAYFARLGEYLAGQGDDVTVWTTTAVELEELWNPSSTPHSALRTPHSNASRLNIRRYPPLAFPARRFILKALSLLPVRRLQALTLPCNPICPAMWRDAGRFRGPLDAVHATAFPYTFPITCGLQLARRRNVPFFLTPFLHLGDSADPHDRTRRQYTRPVMRWLLQQSDGVFVQTEMERDAVIALGVPEEKVILQGLGVDPAECTGGNRAATRAKWGVGDELVIGHLANLSEEKGTVDLLRANLPGRVVLAGPAMPNFERFWQTYPQKDRVTRLGVLTATEKRDFFAGIDVFVLPSRTDSFGLVLLEAWANAKPVIVYRAGGPAELVRDGIDGRVVACTPAAIREAIGTIHPAMGTAGRDRDFAWGPRLEIVRRTILGR